VGVYGLGMRITRVRSRCHDAGGQAFLYGIPTEKGMTNGCPGSCWLLVRSQPGQDPGAVDLDSELAATFDPNHHGRHSMDFQPIQPVLRLDFAEATPGEGREAGPAGR
jgi:hypothetical protein